MTAGTRWAAVGSALVQAESCFQVASSLQEAVAPTCGGQGSATQPGAGAGLTWRGLRFLAGGGCLRIALKSEPEFPELVAALLLFDGSEDKGGRGER